jgi:hypothetical protein
MADPLLPTRLQVTYTPPATTAGAQPVSPPTVTPTRMSVIDRRLANPFGIPSREVPLRGDKRGWVVRIFTADAERPNRHYQAVHELGWVALTVSDLASAPEDLGFVVGTDGRIVRGTRGQDMLMAMPETDFAKVQAAKDAANRRRLGATTLRDSVAQATATAHGDQAGEQTFRHFTRKEVKETISDEDLVPAGADHE